MRHYTEKDSTTHWEIAMKAIKILKENGAKEIYLRMTYHYKNFRDIPRLIAKCKELGIYFLAYPLIRFCDTVENNDYFNDYRPLKMQEQIAVFNAFSDYDKAILAQPNFFQYLGMHDAYCLQVSHGFL